MAEDGAPRHGGTLAEARRRFPGAPEPWIDLSTGINPVPYPLGPASPEAATRLPEPGALRDLQAAAAAAYGAADPAVVVAAPGTQLLISLLPRLLPRPRVTVFGPTYAEHERAWRLAGTAVEDGAAAAVLCNPNNPDGRRLTRDEVAALAARHELLVVDEAFADFDAAISAVPLVGRVPGLVVLRSFGKAYGLAGLRLGFLVAAPEVARFVRDALGPWAVSGAATEAGCRALRDRDWLHKSGRRLAADAARLDGALERAGCRVLGGTVLFRLVRAADAAGLENWLGRRGTAVRVFPERPELLRFGIPGPAEWDRVEEALSSWTRSRTPATRPARR